MRAQRSSACCWMHATSTARDHQRPATTIFRGSKQENQKRHIEETLKRRHVSIKPHNNKTRLCRGGTPRDAPTPRPKCTGVVQNGPRRQCHPYCRHIQRERIVKGLFWFGHNWGALDLPDGTFTHVVDQIIHLGKHKVCSVVDASREPGSAEERSERGRKRSRKNTQLVTLRKQTYLDRVHYNRLATGRWCYSLQRETVLNERPDDANDTCYKRE